MTYKIKHETIIVIFDRNGNFYQYGYDLEKCKSIAETIRGRYKVIMDE